MLRSLTPNLVEWSKSPNRKPLVLMGARQVGKTHILKHLAEHSYDNIAYLNFDLTRDLAELFEGNLDPKWLIPLLALQTKIEIKPGKTLIFFDEIQECPNALLSLKYFNEMANEYHVCAAGSLLGVKLLNTKGFPVGKVNMMYLYPLDFYEFLHAKQELELLEYLEQVSLDVKIPAIIHNKLIELFKIYMIVGGMPEAVYTHISSTTHDFNNVRKVQQTILNAYRLDFAKHAQANMIMKISQVWDSIASQLVKENKKFIYSILRVGARAKDYEDAIQWLTEAELICKTFNIKVPNLPLSAYCNLDTFKLYMFDVGLYGAMADLDPSVLLHGDQLFKEFKGSMTETFVAQTLHKFHSGKVDHGLYYWTSDGKAEVDFVLQQQNKIYPLEVKSGSSNHHRSLTVYQNKYNPEFVLRTSPQNLDLSAKMLNVPLYLMYRLSDFLGQL